MVTYENRPFIFSFFLDTQSIASLAIGLDITGFDQALFYRYVGDATDW
jgi:hypothetical protein